MDFQSFRKWVTQDPTEAQQRDIEDLLANRWLRWVWLLTSLPRRYFWHAMVFLGALLAFIAIMAAGM